MAANGVEVWPTIHAERRALADQLASLTPAQWDTPSLCSEWSVRDVLAHMTATAKLSPAGFFPKLIGSGFSLKRMQDKAVAIERGSSGADALARFGAIVGSSKHPPGPGDSWLGETLVHAEDIRRPLGLQHDYPVAAAAQVAAAYAKSNLVIGAKRRIAGVRLRATDVDWSHGDGPEVSGPIMALVLAMTGRTDAVRDLTGAGVATLSGRP